MRRYHQHEFFFLEYFHRLEQAVSSAVFYTTQWWFAEKNTLRWCFIRGTHLTPSLRMKSGVIITMRYIDPAWAFIHQSIVLSDSLHLREATILVPTITSIMAQNSCKDTRWYQYLLQDLFQKISGFVSQSNSNTPMLLEVHQREVAWVHNTDTSILINVPWHLIASHDNDCQRWIYSLVAFIWAT